MDESAIEQVCSSDRSNAEIVFVDIQTKDHRAATKIQRQAKVYLAYRRFRIALYKLILLKNIVETKVHKETMLVLFAFEQLIMNTEA